MSNWPAFAVQICWRIPRVKAIGSLGSNRGRKDKASSLEGTILIEDCDIFFQILKTSFFTDCL